MSTLVHLGAAAFLLSTVGGCAAERVTTLHAVRAPADCPPRSAASAVDASGPADEGLAGSGGRRSTLLRTSLAIDAVPRPPRGPTVDISFKDADLGNALRLLADAGRFNLVIEEGVRGTVTLLLRGVEPFDALRVIASTKRATVRYENEIVLVRAGT